MAVECLLAVMWAVAGMARWASLAGGVWLLMQGQWGEAMIGGLIWRGGTVPFVVCLLPARALDAWAARLDERGGRKLAGTVDAASLMWMSAVEVGWCLAILAILGRGREGTMSVPGAVLSLEAATGVMWSAADADEKAGFGTTSTKTASVVAWGHMAGIGVWLYSGGDLGYTASAIAAPVCAWMLLRLARAACGVEDPWGRGAANWEDEAILARIERRRH